MQLIIPRTPPQNFCALSNEVFSAVELDRLEALAFRAREEGATGGEASTSQIRRSKIEFLNFNTENAWIYSRIAEVVAAANAAFFHYDLTCIGDQIQLAKYEAVDQGEYDWHIDMGSEVSRKLSVSVQLTDPDRYTGGDLQIFKGGKESLVVDKTRGATAIFSSFRMHCVTPVLTGVRCSLVAWISGPPFR